MDVLVSNNDMRRKLRFRIGLVLIAASYPLWGAAVVFAGMKLRQDGIPWLKFASAALVLNWILFGLGVLMSGREAAGYFNRRVRAWLKSLRHIEPDEASSPRNGRPPSEQKLMP